MSTRSKTRVRRSPYGVPVTSSGNPVCESLTPRSFELREFLWSPPKCVVGAMGGSVAMQGLRSIDGQLQPQHFWVLTCNLSPTTLVKSKFGSTLLGLIVAFWSLERSGLSITQTFLISGL